MHESSNCGIIKMSHLVYITLIGETDDVTLWKLECTHIKE